MIPTACDGRNVTKGKPNPVTLVAIVVTRKTPVQPPARDESSGDDAAREDADQTHHHVKQRERRQAADHRTSFRDEDVGLRTRRPAHTLSPALAPRTRKSLANTRCRSTTSQMWRAKMTANRVPVTAT